MSTDPRRVSPGRAERSIRADTLSGAGRPGRVEDSSGPGKPGRVAEPSGAGKPSGVEPLVESLVVAVRHSGASGGGIYLVDETSRLLGPKIGCGLPRDIAVSWRQVPVTASGPGLRRVP
ncbi:hypothetical protein OG410_02250 [Streptomyces sp. NBC_00659]|uniref:hypothetical protein n=1 Tax=Streptomyces sp. NBC_00659 TaxID=2903669 RepID=UPI002E3590B7|nr:hypothetical protein [Streptomyces sp. NBC_00659]